LRTTVAAPGEGATVKSDSLMKVLCHPGDGPTGPVFPDFAARPLAGGPCYAVFAVAAAGRRGLELFS